MENLKEIISNGKLRLQNSFETGVTIEFFEVTLTHNEIDYYFVFDCYIDRNLDKLSIDSMAVYNEEKCEYEDFPKKLKILLIEEHLIGHECFCVERYELRD
jgi:hypothetical protein